MYRLYLRISQGLDLYFVVRPNFQKTLAYFTTVGQIFKKKIDEIKNERNKILYLKIKQIHEKFIMRERNTKWVSLQLTIDRFIC